MMQMPKTIHEHPRTENELLKLGIAGLMALCICADKWTFVAIIRSGVVGFILVMAYVCLMVWLMMSGMEVDDEEADN